MLFTSLDYGVVASVTNPAICCDHFSTFNTANPEQTHPLYLLEIYGFGSSSPMSSVTSSRSSSHTFRRTVRRASLCSETDIVPTCMRAELLTRCCGNQTLTRTLHGSLDAIRSSFRPTHQHPLHLHPQRALEASHDAEGSIWAMSHVVGVGG